MRDFLFRLANFFPGFVLTGAVLALFFPEWFVWFRGNWIVLGLGVVMLGMGSTLEVDDFRRVLQIPGAVLAGFVAQFTLMPLLGWTLGRFFQLPPALAVGLILVACCPGGTASNIVTYLAGANVALSVTMTMVSTIAAVALTPLLTGWLAGTLVPVDAAGLFFSTAQVVIAPLCLGLLLHHFAPKFTFRFVQPVAPLLSGLVVAMICASIIGQNSSSLLNSAGALFLAVVSLHAAGFGLGYAFARAFRFCRTDCQTISIEVGMQNSGLGVVLAQRHFSDPLTAVPAALSSVIHSVLGSMLAGWWRWRKASAREG